jgi:hypothetical protein
MTPHLKNHEESNKTTINSDLLITSICIYQYETWLCIGELYKLMIFILSYMHILFLMSLMSNVKQRLGTVILPQVVRVKTFIISSLSFYEWQWYKYRWGWK